MKTHQLKPTKHPDVFRVVDREGNWENYFVKSLNLYLPGVTTILNRGYLKGPQMDEWLSRHTAAERERILQSAGEKGDKVHRAIDLMLSADYPPGAKPFFLEQSIGIFNRETKDYEPIANNEWDALLAFQSFWQAHEPQVLVSEATLYNTLHGFAGTADAVLMLTKKCDVKACKCEELVGEIGLYDWKTSSGIRASYGAQVAAYAFAGNLADHLPKGKRTPDYTAVLRLGTNHKTTGGYEFKPFSFRETCDNFERFLAAQRIAAYEHKPFNPDEDIQEIPDAIELTVKKFDFNAAEAKEAAAPLFEKKVETKPKKLANGKTKGNSGKTAHRSKAHPRNQA